jgi:hypothetical protein
MNPSLIIFFTQIILSFIKTIILKIILIKKKIIHLPGYQLKKIISPQIIKITLSLNQEIPLSIIINSLKIIKTLKITLLKIMFLMAFQLTLNKIKIKFNEKNI